jgi:hypothetical protein
MSDKERVATPLTDAHLAHLNTFDGRKIGIPDSTLDLCRTLESVAAALREAAKHAVMEWRLHGSLTDSCRKLEATLPRADKVLGKP